MRLSALSLSFLMLVLSPLALLAQGSKPIRIHADLTDAPRKLFHADVELPVSHGPLDLVTPEWIPGGHGPYGPVSNIVGLRFEADGKVLPWRRDPVDTYEYHLDIPPGVTTLHAHLDSVQTKITRVAATLEWGDLLLYPAHVPVAKIAIQPTVTVPEGWGIGTSLKPTTAYDPQHPAGGTVEYTPTTVEMLQDSPVMAGLHFREYPLAAGTTPAHVMDVIGPTEASIEVKPETLAQMSRLVAESFAMYGPPHYTGYHFLVLLQGGSDGGGGLEHHESSDNTVPANFFTGYKANVEMAGLLPHEFTHSWNGKYRRPDGLATPDFATPMQDNLLWVYEGLTDYLGNVMGERIGSVTAEAYRGYLAVTAATMETQSGRQWRSIEDTTFSSAMPRNGSRGQGWSSWRRGTDYYAEGDLLWLDVDTTIRRLTHERKTLRDFLQIFFLKGGTGSPHVEPYSLTEVEADLNKVVANDWAGFFRTRVYDVQPHVNVEGIEQGGYRLEYAAEPTPEVAAAFTEQPPLAAWLSVGVYPNADGTIADVRVGSVADKARLAPGQKITAIDGRAFSYAVFLDAVKAAQGSGKAMQWIVQDEDTVAPVSLTYGEGLRYPRLVRVEDTPDRLGEILKPMTLK